MISKNRKSKRKTLLRFRVSAEEENMIKTKTEQIGIISMSANLSKMDGYVINLEMPELREMISLLRSSSNNHNQIAIHINTTGRIYDKNMEEILRWQENFGSTRTRL